jgi:predicted transposase/invertase (TIGR01784 family)
MLVKEWDWDKALKIRGEESFEEGMEAGMERGIEKGMERATLRNALAMKEDGVDISSIARWTGLPVDTILNL